MALERSHDPVCGKPVDPERAPATDYKKRRYYFCSSRCKERFEQQTEKMRLQELARLGALFANAKVRWGVA